MYNNDSQFITSINSNSLSCLSQKYEAIKQTNETWIFVQLNIKNFRYYNTKYGITAGNEILLLVFQKICSLLNEDEYCTHLYADNFGILMKYEVIDIFIYDRMIRFMDNLYRIDDERIYRNLFLSMGSYAITSKESTLHDALNYANLCRKECNTLLNRSNCLELYDKSFYDSYMERMKMEVKTAEAYKNYDFVTYLQPKVNLKTGRIVGAEALLRWFDEDGNTIPAYKFFPILNQNNYIKLIDLDTFEHVCKFLDERTKNRQHVVPISFNISKSYFYDPNMLSDYTRIFEKYNLPKSVIELELMESISMDDTKHLKKVTEDLKAYGFSCSLDDFGNGYSSFNTLLNAQLDIVKLDRQFFINNVRGDVELIVSSIINLIHSLNMKVVAEGVELQQHIDLLKQCDCDYVQGFYYYKPMPVEEFEKLLELESEH